MPVSSREADEREVFNTLHPGAFDFGLEVMVEIKGYRTGDVCWRDEIGGGGFLVGRAIWVVPPKAEVGPYARKAMRESFEHTDLTIVLLVPASPGAGWWADYVAPASEVWFWPGKVLLEGEPTDAAIVVWRPRLMYNERPLVRLARVA